MIKCTDKSNGLHFCTGVVCVFYLLVRLNIDLIFFSKWWAGEIRCRMLHNEPIPLPIIQECFEHWCTVQNAFLYYGTEGVAVNVSTVIDDVQSLQEDCRAKPLQKHWVDSKFM